MWRRLLRLRGTDIHSDVETELRFHIEMRTRDLVAAGWQEAAARAEAQRQFGDVGPVRDACITIDERRHRRRDRREAVADMMQDVKFAARALRKSPTFSAMAITCVALGVCVTTTIFSAVHGILLRPLPFADADRLVAIYSRDAAHDAHHVNISYPDYASWRDGNRTFSQLGMWTWTTKTLSGDGEAERVSGAAVTANLFSLLGVPPMLGRAFTSVEERPGQNMVILLSHGLWQRRFAGARDVIGRSITVDGQQRTVIGVMPPRFNFPDQGQVWVPFVTDATTRERGNRVYAGAIGRLTPTSTIAQAQSDLDAISARLRQDFHADDDGWDAEAIPLRRDLVGDLERPLVVFLVAVSLVLVIACANVANLMLARGTARQREVAVRVALGAVRSRIIRQLLTESMVIAVLGGLAGAFLARYGIQFFRLAFPNDVPFYIALEINWTVLAFALGITALTGIVVGLVPALRATRVDLQGSLKDGTRSAGEARERSRLRNALVVAELALSLVLLIGASLLIQSYRALITTDLGFDTRGILSARISLSNDYAAYPRRQGYWEELYRRLSALPGVQRVGSANGIPFSGWNLQALFSIEGSPARRRGDDLVVHYQYVSPDFFTAIGVPIVRGRGFTNADRDSTQRIAIISTVFARREFGGVDPIGKRIKFGGPDSNDPWVTIVGVAREYRHYRLPTPMGPAIYFPQLATPSYSQTLAIRTSLAEPEGLATDVRRVIRELDPNVPAYQVQTFEEAVGSSLWRQRLQGQVLGAFAMLALILAMVGIYGVISYAVAQRTRELGVRIALGATRLDVVRLVVGEGARLALLGVGLGIAGALALGRLVSSLLYNVAPTDLATFIVVPLALGLVALVACYIPARRATKLDPVVALRSD